MARLTPSPKIPRSLPLAADPRSSAGPLRAYIDDSIHDRRRDSWRSLSQSATGSSVGGISDEWSGSASRPRTLIISKPLKLTGSMIVKACSSLDAKRTYDKLLTLRHRSRSDVCIQTRSRPSSIGILARRSHKRGYYPLAARTLPSAASSVSIHRQIEVYFDENRRRMEGTFSDTKAMADAPDT